MIVDTHTHLLDKFFDSDRDDVIRRCLAEGLCVIEVALSHCDWESALKLSKEHKNFFLSAGFHPHDAKDVSDDDIMKLKEFCLRENVVAVGETGLDYYHKNSPASRQEDVFRKEIEVAMLIQKPLIIHCREAYSDCLATLKGISKSYKGVIHCFSGTIIDLEDFVELGFHIGIDGPITYPSAKQLTDAVKSLDIKRMLVETDSPYLPPQNIRGERNEPLYVKHVIAKIAEIKGMSFGEISRITADNAKKLFGIRCDG